MSKLQKLLDTPEAVKVKRGERNDFNTISLESIQEQAYQYLVGTTSALKSNMDLMFGLEAYSDQFIKRGQFGSKDLAVYGQTLQVILSSHGITADTRSLIPSMEDSEQDNQARIKQAIEKVLAWIKQFIEDLGSRFKTYLESSEAVNLAIDHKVSTLADSIKQLPHQKEAVVHKVLVSNLIQTSGKLDQAKLNNIYQLYMGPQSLFRIEFPLKKVVLNDLGTPEFTRQYREMHEAYKDAHVKFTELFEERFGENLYDEKSEVEVTSSQGLLQVLDMVSRANKARENYVSACDAYYKNAIEACNKASSNLDLSSNEGYETSKAVAEFLRTANATHSEFGYFNKSFVKIVAQPLRDLEALVKAFS